jgi:hypothetical protein
MHTNGPYIFFGNSVSIFAWFYSTIFRILLCFILVDNSFPFLFCFYFIIFCICNILFWLKFFSLLNFQASTNSRRCTSAGGYSSSEAREKKSTKSAESCSEDEKTANVSVAIIQ